MNAIEKVLSIYNIDELKEIADHGCQSGVCHEHIYYGHTVEFYDTFENDILETIRDAYDTEFLIELFKDADASLTLYKNSVTWAFIEMVAFDAVDEELQKEMDADAMIDGYMLPLTSYTTEDLGNKIMAMGL